MRFPGRQINLRSRAGRSLCAGLLALAALSALGSSAAASESGPTPSVIEGVWSFNGGAVAIQSLSNGNLQGIVVNPTKFATCEHPSGEVMWTDMRQQPDGSFWGLHHWFKGGEKCEANPLLGFTAWRVLTAADGSRSLKVCFSIPGDNSQPTIAPDGSAADATFGCTESSSLGGLPGSKGDSSPPSFAGVVGVPAADKVCQRRRSLKIVLHNLKYDPLKEVLVRVNGKKVADITDPEALKKSIRLKKLPEGTYKVSVLAITVLNERLTGRRTYRSCVKGPGKIKVPGGKVHSHP